MTARLQSLDMVLIKVLLSVAAQLLNGEIRRHLYLLTFQLPDV